MGNNLNRFIERYHVPGRNINWVGEFTGMVFCPANFALKHNLAILNLAAEQLRANTYCGEV